MSLYSEIKDVSKDLFKILRFFIKPFLENTKLRTENDLLKKELKRLRASKRKLEKEKKHSE